VQTLQRTPLEMIITTFAVFMKNFRGGPVSSNIYRPTINSTGPNLKTTLLTINSNHQNSKHDDVPKKLCGHVNYALGKTRMQVKKQKDTLFWIHVYINLLKILKSYCQ
jgi:hypothetical protein